MYFICVRLHGVVDCSFMTHRVTWYYHKHWLFYLVDWNFPFSSFILLSHLHLQPGQTLKEKGSAKFKSRSRFIPQDVHKSTAGH